MNDYTVKRNYKDSLFCILFGEKENALALYNALNNSNHTNTEDLIITTLDSAIYISVRNDVAFLVDDVLNLYEHQSTFSRNIPLRGLSYFTETYKVLFGNDPIMQSGIYDSRLIKIPTPRFIVFYNGVRDQPERIDLHLSSMYEGEGDVEVTAHMININRGNNADLMKACRPLSDYSELVYRIRVNLSKDMSKEEAVRLAIDNCIEDSIMEDLLRRERAKVANALLDGLTDEQIEWLHDMQLKRERDEGKAEGIAEGITQGKAEGEELILSINNFLLSQKRYEDLERATTDPVFRQSILEEMDDGTHV